MCSQKDKMVIRRVILSQNNPFDINKILNEVKVQKANVTTYDVVNTARTMCDNGALDYKNGKFFNVEVLA